MLSPINVFHDTSNGSWNVFVLEVLKSFHYINEVGEKVETWELQPWFFPTQGKAMSFVQNEIAERLYQPQPGAMWEAELRCNNSFKGLKVRINQLVLVNE